MNLLAAKLYDPAVAVSKATSALLAMTAFDTTNLRLAITVPAHGMVRFRLRCVITGATTCPTILLGVMNGATIIGRVTPLYQNDTANVATQAFLCDVEFTVTGLAPGAMNVDAAYGVEVVVAATNIKYGGPNDTTGTNAWGGFVFEAWDPQPQSTTGQLQVDVNGRTDVGRVLGTAQTAGDLKASLNTLQADTDDIQTRLPAALVGGRMDSSVGAMAANVITAASIAALALAGKGDWISVLVDTSGVTTLLARLTALRAIALDNLDATVSSRSTYAGADTAGITTLLARVSAARALLLDNLDAAISSRSTYAGGDTAGTTALVARLTALRAAALDLLDVAISSRSTFAGGAVASVTGSVDSVVQVVSADMKKINGTTVHGDGSATPWGP